LPAHGPKALSNIGPTLVQHDPKMEALGTGTPGSPSGGRPPAAMSVPAPCAQRRRASISVARKNVQRRWSHQSPNSWPTRLLATRAKRCFPRACRPIEVTRLLDRYRVHHSFHGPGPVSVSHAAVTCDPFHSASLPASPPVCQPHPNPLLLALTHRALSDFSSCRLKLRDHRKPCLCNLCVRVCACLVSMHLCHIASRYGGGKKNDSILSSPGSCARAV